MNKKIYRVRAKYMDNEGRGVVNFNHSMIPVPGLLPSELAEITLYRRKDETLGKIVGLVEESPDRIESVCPYFQQCGGCQLCHMSYDAQLKYKRKCVNDLMGHLNQVPEVLGMKEPLWYRCKVHGTFGYGSRGIPVAGIYQEKSHRLLPVKECRIQNQYANEIIEWIRAHMEKYRISPYNEDSGRGLLRHVLVRTGYYTGQVMVVLVVSTFKFPQGKGLCEKMLHRFPQIKTIVYNLNNKKTSMVLGDEHKIVYGDGYIEDRLCGLTFRISPKSFFQVNPPQAEILYEKAIQLAGISKNDQVLDAYCGTGTISLIAAKYASYVTGVEINSDAVRDAKENAMKNNIKNVQFICQDAKEYIRGLTVDFHKKPYYNVVIMDPPRSGSDRRFLEALVKFMPEKIVYISCNPHTQMRDSKIIMSHGYEVAQIQPVDMFPMTVGIENIVLFKRR